MGKMVLLPFLFTLFASTMIAQDPCSEEVAYQWLDFWVGEWEVFNEKGKKLGDNSIRKVLNGCAVEEHWESINGQCGRSFFYIDNDRARWEQIWVTEQATRPGGQKEKHFIERRDDGTMVFEGSYMVKMDRVVDRTTLIPKDNGQVRQVIEVSKDRGETWETVFLGIYKPKSE